MGEEPWPTHCFPPALMALGASLEVRKPVSFSPEKHHVHEEANLLNVCQRCCRYNDIFQRLQSVLQ